MISFNPLRIAVSSSGSNLVIFFLIRLLERVLIRLILTHDFLGREGLESLNMRGKPALGFLLVIATATTVPDVIEDIVTEYKYRSFTTLFVPDRGVEVSPENISP